MNDYGVFAAFCVDCLRVADKAPPGVTFDFDTCEDVIPTRFPEGRELDALVCETHEAVREARAAQVGREPVDE
jgi:hypothetical protein